MASRLVRTSRAADDDPPFLGIASLLGSVGLGAAAVLSSVGAGGLTGTAVAATAGGVLPILITAALARLSARRHLARLHGENVTPEQRQALLEDLSRLDPRVVREAIRQTDSNDPLREALIRLVKQRGGTSPTVIPAEEEVAGQSQVEAGSSLAAVRAMLTRGIGVAVRPSPSEEEINYVIIPSGSTLPMSHTVHLMTATAMQSVISVKITLGDSKDLAECRILGEWSYPLTDPAEVIPVELEMSVTATNFLRIELRTSAAGKVLGTAELEYGVADKETIHRRATDSAHSPSED